MSGAEDTRPADIARALGQASRLRKAGREAESIAPLRRAARLAPLNWQIQHDLGLSLLKLGHLGEATAALKQTVANNPSLAEGHWRLGIALQRQADTDAAIEAYRTATKLKPGLADAQYRLATLLEAKGHRTEAIGRYRRAAASSGKTSLGRIAQARLLMVTNDDLGAERVLRQVLALDPANATAHDMLGNVLADAGKFEAARAHFEAAIAHGPWLAGTYYDLVRCRRITSDDKPLVARMQTALNNQSLDAGQKLKVQLALGKAADDLGEYRLAMQWFDAADVTRRGLLDFDLCWFEQRVDRLIRWFTPELFAKHVPGGCSDELPVLIVGMPRSGTTLIEQIVSSHSSVVAAGELHFWNRRGSLLEQESGIEPGFLAQAAVDCLAHLRGISARAPRITDKMPSNFLWAGLVHLVFPKATIIHCRRLAIDTALSIHQTHFAPRLGFPTGGTDLVGYYRAYERLMAHWRRVLPADRFIQIDYEHITSAPDAPTRRMIDAIGLPWQDACLRPEENDRVIRTASKWQARQPIYRTAVDKWRRYEMLLGPLAALVDVDRS